MRLGTIPEADFENRAAVDEGGNLILPASEMFGVDWIPGFPAEVRSFSGESGLFAERFGT
jgi:hypothetical protein